MSALPLQESILPKRKRSVVSVAIGLAFTSVTLVLPCAALAQVCGDYSNKGRHSELRVAWAIFAMAADRKEPVGEWPKYEAPLRWDPDL